jgi:hypothetical protein
MNEKQDVIRHQTTQRPHLGDEEVRGHQHIHMDTQEVEQAQLKTDPGVR